MVELFWKIIWQFLMKLKYTYYTIQRFHFEVFTQESLKFMSKYLYVNVHGGFIHYWEKLEIIQMCFTLINKMWDSICNRILLSHEKGTKYYIHKNMDGFLKCFMLTGRNQTQEPIFCIISFIWHSGKAKL